MKNSNIKAEKRGHWIASKPPFPLEHMCSCCKCTLLSWAEFDDFSVTENGFPIRCPNCNAIMDEEEKEKNK